MTLPIGLILKRIGDVEGVLIHLISEPRWGSILSLDEGQGGLEKFCDFSTTIVFCDETNNQTNLNFHRETP